MCENNKSNSKDSGLVTVAPITNRFDIHFDSTIVESDEYREVFAALRQAGPHDEVHIHINTCGGNADTALQLWDAIMSCRGITIAHIHKAYSAGAIIAVACKNVSVRPFASMMIHSVSLCVAGKLGNETEKSIANCRERYGIGVLKKLFSNFITEPEYAKIEDGLDLYLGEAEITRRYKKLQEEVLAKTEKAKKKV